jgi:cytochrome b
LTSQPGASRTVRVLVWDAPVRLIHWLMVLLFAVSWRSAETGAMNYHRYSGYALLGLLLFRIYWGFAGSTTARFSSFVKGPRAVLAYLRQMPQRTGARQPAVPGHNPLGALSVLALLMLLSTQVLLGLFAVDIDGIESGPLSLYVSFDTGRSCAAWHGRVFEVLLWMIGLHIAAVLFYLLYKRDNLIASMLHGRRAFPVEAAPAITRGSVVRLLSGVVLAALIVWAVTRAFQFRFP